MEDKDEGDAALKDPQETYTPRGRGGRKERGTRGGKTERGGRGAPRGGKKPNSQMVYRAKKD